MTQEVQKMPEASVTEVEAQMLAVGDSLRSLEDLLARKLQSGFLEAAERGHLLVDARTCRQGGNSRHQTLIIYLWSVVL